MVEMCRLELRQLRHFEVHRSPDGNLTKNILQPFVDCHFTDNFFKIW